MGKYDFDFGYNVPQPDYKTDDPPTYEQECFGLMVCPHCGKAAMCNRVTNLTEQEETMINRTQNQPSSNAGSGILKKKRNGLPFLTTAEASLSKQPATIVAARVQDDTFKPGNQIVAMRIRYKGQDWLYNLRSSNPVLETLCADLGDDETQWTNKQIMVFNEEDQFNAKLWLRFEAVQHEQEDEHEEAEPNPVPQPTPSRRKK